MRFQMILAGFALALLSACGPSHWQAEGDHSHPLRPETQAVLSSDLHDARTRIAYVGAGAYIEKLSKFYGRNRWAVAMDLDQTVLNNITYHAEMDRVGRTHNDHDWHHWTQAKQATLIAGAKDFIARVNALGGSVVFVTNRKNSEQLATEENLAALGIVRGRDFKDILTHALPYGSKEKDARFAVIPSLLRAQGYPNARVIAYVGDVKGDRPKWLPRSARFFCIPQGRIYGEYCD